MSINTVVLQGRMTADPELRTTSTGKECIFFTIAVDRKFSTENKVDFIPIVAWERNALFISRYFKKGSMIAVEGEITSRIYESNGKKTTKIEVVASHASFCGSKSESQQTTTQEQKTAQNGSQSLSVQFDEDDVPDDLPF